MRCHSATGRIRIPLREVEPFDAAQALCEETGADEQQHAQGRLYHEQRRPCARRAPTASGKAGTQGVAQVRRGALHEGRKADQHARAEGDDRRKGEQADVDDSALGGVGEHQAPEQASAEQGEVDRGSGAEAREQLSLGEHLPHQPLPPGA